MTTQNPTPAAVRAVADRFEALAAKESTRVDMTEIYVKRKDIGICGCHAGLYAVARRKGDVRWRDRIAWIDLHLNLFIVGYKCLADDMGFSGSDDLCFWASLNPDIWGNLCGQEMLAHEQAFAHTPAMPPMTAADLAAHWHGVADRLEASQSGD